MKIISLLASLFFYCSLSFGVDKISSKQFKLEKVYKGDGVLWSFDFLDENNILLAFRSGKLLRYNTKEKKVHEVAFLEVAARDQGGLLDLAVKDNQVFATFSEPLKMGRMTTSLARATFDKNFKVSPFKRVFQSNAIETAAHHFGSRLLFVGDDLYMTVGDRGQRDKAQDQSTHHGTILKLDKKFTPTVFSYGHRNPQGIDLDPMSKSLFEVEFGPRGGDEINKIEKGSNYGWPIVTHGKEYYGPKIGVTHKEGMVDPVEYWVPSISPSALHFYRGDKIKEWQNKAFLACLSARHIRMLEIKEGRVVKQSIVFSDLARRVRDIQTGPDGYFYFSTDNGQLYRVSKN